MSENVQVQIQLPDYKKLNDELRARAEAAGMSVPDFARKVCEENRKKYGPRYPEYDIQGAWFQPPYTTVKWMDGTTTTVKCDAEDAYDPKTGVLLCFAKRLFAGGKYNDALKKALGMVPDLSHEVLMTMTLDDGPMLNVYGDGTMDVKSLSIKSFLCANPSVKTGITIQAGAR